MSGVTQLANYVKIMIPAVCLFVTVKGCQTDAKIDAVNQKIETVDSTMKSWDAAMKPMAAQANAKKAMILKKTADSAKAAVIQHKMDSVKTVLANLEKEAVNVAKTVK